MHSGWSILRPPIHTMDLKNAISHIAVKKCSENKGSVVPKSTPCDPTEDLHMDPNNLCYMSHVTFLFFPYVPMSLFVRS